MTHPELETVSMAEEEGSGVKDLTVTSFGLVIAYLLPGLVGLYGLSFWSKKLSQMFSTFLTSESNIGLFLIVVLASLAIGLLANGLRWVAFEMLFFKKHRTQSSFHKTLAGERKLAAYRVVIDETYRYHQWWGGIAFTIPIGYFGWLVGSWHATSGLQKASITALLVGVEVLCLIAASHLWIYTVMKLTNLLGEGVTDNGRNTDGPDRQAAGGTGRTTSNGTVLNNAAGLSAPGKNGLDGNDARPGTAAPAGG
jgi:hypothetical protein